METDIMISRIRKSICSEVDISKEGIDRYLILTPFTFSDGDVYKIVLKRVEAEDPYLTDEGHTLMHLSYEDIDVDSGTRSRLLEDILSRNSIRNEGGEMRMGIDGMEDIGNAVYSFIQGISSIGDLDFLKRERIRSTFYEDVKDLIRSNLEGRELVFDTTIEEHDAQGLYPVDCIIKGEKKDVFLFSILNDDKCRDATISLMQFERFGLDLRSIAIFQNQEEINRKVLSRFSDVCDKQFSTIDSAADRIYRVLDAMS